MRLTISTNFPDVARQLDQLQQDVAKQATARAINRTMDQSKTAVSREIRGEFNISAGKVSQSLRITRATFHNGLYRMQATLESPTQRGRSLNLINFAARQTAKGVTVQIKRGTGRKLLAGAFIANQGRTVFQRVGKARLPIKALQTIDVAQMFNTKRINAKVVQFMQTKFPEVFEREARYYTDRFNARRAGQ